MHVKDMTRISRWLDENDIPYELNADLSRKTWVKNGGFSADICNPPYFEPT